MPGPRRSANPQSGARITEQERWLSCLPPPLQCFQTLQFCAHPEDMARAGPRNTTVLGGRKVSVLMGRKGWGGDDGKRPLQARADSRLSISRRPWRIGFKLGGA